MNLKDIRKQKGLTQKQAALLIGVPYRTYLRYEEDPKYIDTYKYQMIISSLEDKTKIDEEHGLLDVDTIKKVLLPILKEKGISYCYLFGSYARANPKENSDIDLLVDTDITGFDFYNLVEEMRTSLHKKIDLLRLNDLKENNPIILEILKYGIRII